MEQIISTIISSLSPSALPIVIVIIGVAYLYFRFNKLEKDRDTTKSVRDNDSQEIHDKLLTHDFKLAELKGRIELHDTVLSDINKQINILNTNLAILTEKIDNLTNVIKEVKNDRQLQSK